MIIAISDSRLFNTYNDFKNHLLNLVNSDIDHLIIRENQLDKDVYTALLLSLLAASPKACRKIIVHTRTHLARNIGLTQVHLPEKAIDQPRQLHTKYSYAIHNIANLPKVQEDALFILVSPIFKTTCKPSATLLSTDEINTFLSLSPVSVVALGGVDDSRLQQTIALGFKNVAMRSALMNTNAYQLTIDLYKNAGF